MWICWNDSFLGRKINLRELDLAAGKSRTRILLHGIIYLTDNAFVSALH